MTVEVKGSYRFSIELGFPYVDYCVLFLFYF